MGETIRKTAAREDILQDVKTTRTNATARGGVPASLADQRLLPVLTIIVNVSAQLEAARTLAAPLLAALAVADAHADRTIGKVSDDIWNDIGRPGSDAAFELLFPGGNAFYVDGDVTEQPDRMDLLAELLGANVHPKVSPEVAKASIAIISAESMNLRAAVEASRPVRAKVQLLERVLLAVTRSAAIELAQLKRLLKANGFTEADIHTMIPDRSSAPGKKEALPAKAAPATPAGSPPNPDQGHG
ncbi:MAG: hypothetical protein ABI134_02060 [Byssovorax sp.]